VRVSAYRTSLLLLTFCLLYHISAASQTAQAIAYFPVVTCSGQESSGGQLHVDLSDIVGRRLPGKVLLKAQDGTQSYLLRVPEGSAIGECPLGKFTAYTYVYELGVPILVDVREIVVDAGVMASLPLTLIEGSAGQRTLLAFDADRDLVLDRI